MKILSEKDSINIILKGKYPISGWNYYFKFCTSGYQEDAKNLVIDNLLKAFWKEIEALKEKMYNKGWKDAKSHKKKENYFTGNMEDL